MRASSEKTLKAKIADLNSALAAKAKELVAAQAAASNAEGVWRRALGSQALGEGDAKAVTAARARLDATRELLIGLEGAVSELQQRLANGQEELNELLLEQAAADAQVAALGLEQLADDLIELDRQAAGKVAEITQRMAEAMDARARHIGLIGEGPGILPSLHSRVSRSLLRSADGNRENAIEEALYLFYQFTVEFHSGGHSRQKLGRKSEESR